MYYRIIENQLQRWLKNERRKPLILNGVRQVGKTTILKKFASDNFETCHYFNFETSQRICQIFENTLNPEEILNGLMIETGQVIREESDILFFDEIQACPRALHSLKYFCEQKPLLAVCAAGSLLGVRLSKEPFPIGKVDELGIYPLNFYEFLLAINEDLIAKLLIEGSVNQAFPSNLHTKLWELWKLYLVVGGLPEVIQVFSLNRAQLLTGLQAAREKQSLLISEYLRDMAKHAGEANAMHLERVFKAIPGQLARAQDDSVKRFRFKGVVPGISQYSRLVSAFDWLKAAGLVYKIPVIDSVKLPLTQHVKENIFKLYLFDVGILGALGEMPLKTILDFDFGTYKGYLAENYTLQALKVGGIGPVYGWNEGTSEIEFLTMTASDILPIEVKAGRVTQAKSLQVFIRRYKPERAIIFGATTPRIDDNVLRLPIYTAGIWPLTPLAE